jgi:uncharacterized membrane protein YkvA (DUF1232 family)
VHLLIGLASALAIACLAMTAVVFRAVRRGHSLTELGRLVPNLARLLMRLAHDRTIPLSVRARIYIAIAYNIQPINLIPDFVPVIGLVDNVLVILWALRSTVRHAGREVIVRHWTGTSEGLATLFRLVGIEEED